MNYTKVVFGQQVFTQMFARGVAPEIVTRALKSGEIIEEYNDDEASTHYLVLYIEKEKPLHVVAEKSEQDGVCYVMTAYWPDRRLWNDDFKTRRKG